MAARQTQSKKMTSIVRRLNIHFLWKRVRMYIAYDLLLALVLLGGLFLFMEYDRTGRIDFSNHREITFSLYEDVDSTDVSGAGHDIFYRVTKEDGEELFVMPVLPVARAVTGFLIVLVILEVFILFFSYFGEDRKIRRIMRPINEIALKADELSRLSFGEDKYQRIEDVITRVRVTDDERLSFGDKDLMGIEAAMNNLLTRMRDANAQQARFVNDASHELRTPIAVIRGYADMLDRWGSEDETVRAEAITAIRNEADHMNHLVEQLLFLARGDAGKTTLHPETLSLNAIAKELYEESLMIDKDHVYRLEVPDEEIPVSVDIALFKQAARVLIDNAAKYTKEQDEICIGTGLTVEEQPYLQVQDTGIGMAEADVAHMFERFYRSEDVRTYKGTGLGLSIAKWIVDKHGGHFETLSREGLGTRIRIVLGKSVKI